VLPVAIADLDVILQRPNPIETSQEYSLPTVVCILAGVNLIFNTQMLCKLGLDQIINLSLQELNGRPLLILL
jgi:hypothetical protein